MLQTKGLVNGRLRLDPLPLLCNAGIGWGRIQTFLQLPETDNMTNMASSCRDWSGVWRSESTQGMNFTLQLYLVISSH